MEQKVGLWRRLFGAIRRSLSGNGRKMTFREMRDWFGEFAEAHFANIAASLVLAGWFQIEIFGVGGQEFTDWRTGNDWVSSIACMLILAFIFLRLSLSRMGRVTMIIIALALGGLAPLRLTVDMPLCTSQSLDTMLATDVAESLDFLATIPAKLWPIGAALAGTASGLIALAENPVNRILSARAMASWKLIAWLLLIAVPAFSPLSDIFQGVGRIVKINLFATEPSWHVTGRLAGEQSDIYVLVMGESLSTRVMGLYGAPYPTTPFLCAEPSRRLKTAVAPHLGTATAVSSFTTLPTPGKIFEPQYENNIIALAKEAGLRTYWVSTQGRVSAYEASVSYIAGHADEKHFVSKRDDFGMLPLLRELILKPEPEGRKKFLFVHTYGAHEKTCDRVTDVGRPWKTGAEEFLDCYLAAAYKADLTVKSIVEALKQSGKTWSLIFTSDHALQFRREKDGELAAMRSFRWTGQYEVPFVLMGQGATRPGEEVPVVRATAQFPNFFPTWIGVKTNRTPEGYDIFNSESDKRINIIKDDKESVTYASLKVSPSLADVVASAPRKEKSR